MFIKHVSELSLPGFKCIVIVKTRYHTIYLKHYRNGCYSFTDNIHDAQTYRYETARKHEAELMKRYGGMK